MAPFSAELLWGRLRSDGSSVHTQLLPEPREELIDQELEESMRLVVRVVEMGRALRERSGLRVRQPLRGLHVRASDPAALELLGGPFATAQVLDELNIKAWGSLDGDDGELCALRAKADFKRLGKRLGKRMKAAAAVIAELPSGPVAALRGGAPVTIEVDGEPLEITPEEVQITGFSFGPGSFRTWPDTVAGLGLPPERFATIIHPRAYVSPQSQVGRGTVILAGTTVGAFVTLGDHVIVLQNVGLSHDDVIEDFSCLAVGVSFSGSVRVGRNCFLGTNSTIIGATLGPGSLIGAGTLIRQDVPSNEIWVGVPGRFLRKCDEREGLKQP